MRIVTFNVYWLQGSGYEDYRPGEPRADVLAGVAGLLTDLRGDLLCIQEAQSFEAARALAAVSRMTWWLYRPGATRQRPQYGGAVFTRDNRWAFAPVVDDRLERFAVKAVRDGDGLCVANVHLRSDRFESADAAARSRREELTAIVDADPCPHVVCGDFNSRWHTGLWDLLRRRGYFDAAERAGQAEAPTSIGQGQGDRIWIRAELADRFVSAEVIAKDRTRMDDEEYLSDHLPVVAELEL